MPLGVGPPREQLRLTERDARFTLFRRIKFGSGSTTGYRIVDQATLGAISAADDVVWSNEQYGATYIVDRTGLVEHLEQGVPVLHLGQAAAIDAVIGAVPATTWLLIGLWCPRDVAAARLAKRGSADLVHRLAVWDATPPLRPPACTLNTALVRPAHAAALIAATVLDHVAVT